MKYLSNLKDKQKEKNGTVGQIENKSWVVDIKPPKSAIT